MYHRSRVLRVLAFLFILVAGGCGNTLGSSTGPDRVSFADPIPFPRETTATWNIRDVQVVVPETLTVSTDPDTRFPNTNIVWWEDPPGDRRAQVSRIMLQGLEQGTRAYRGRVPVILQAQVVQFHGLTPKARAGGAFGWHDLAYMATIYDATTGKVLARSGAINADIKAFQGRAAQDAVARGDTQAVRISRTIAHSISAWLNSSGP